MQLDDWHTSHCIFYRQSGAEDLQGTIDASLRSVDPSIAIRQLFSQLSRSHDVKVLSNLFLQVGTIHFGLSVGIEAAVKQGDTYLGVDVSLQSAWRHVVLGNAFDSARRPVYDYKAEEGQVATYSAVFKEGFWPKGIGSKNSVPIFIVGLMRSGSTLVESVLAAHSQGYGMGEDSVFNGMLPVIRDGVVDAIGSGNIETLKKVVDTFAVDVAKGMK